MATTKVPHKKKEKIKRPDLKIGIKDFGPIAEGEIELKPLTVFIGPNNSGKSYAAMLIYSILNTYSIPFNSPQWRRSFSKKRDVNAIFDDSLELSELLEEINHSEGLGAIEIPREIIEKVSYLVLKEISEEILAKNIINFYACQLNELNRIGINSFELDISSEIHRIRLVAQDNNLGISESKQIDINITITMEPTKVFDQYTGIPNEEIEVWVHTDKGMNVGTVLEKWESLSQSDLVEFVLLVCSSEIYESLRVSCNYLPATRSDKFQFYKLIGGNILRQHTIPKFLGVVLDYISSIIEISPERKSHYYQFAEELERELLKGNIVFESSDANLLPEAKYKFQDNEIPLQRASSSVSELAPLILYLKYIVEPNSVLIIEEPEAHLHPANIRILAKYLVRLVRQGVNVVITTHSEYLLEQLNNFYLMSKIDPEDRRERYNYDKDDYLNYDDLGVYEFHYDEGVSGYKIRRSEISEDDGISQEEFVKIFESLYDETSKLRSDLDDE